MLLVMAQLNKSQDKTHHIGKIVTFLISIGINKKHKMSFDYINRKLTWYKFKIVYSRNVFIQERCSHEICKISYSWD